MKEPDAIHIFDAFNTGPRAAALELLLGCCASPRWAAAVADGRPFESPGDLEAWARARWQDAEEPELLEAFAAHPRIGDLDVLRARYGRAHAEQGQVLAAEDAVIERLAQRNDAYFERFGFIFIVCASGKSAAEMLALLEARIGGDRAQELANAAREQEAIMTLRLRQALNGAAS